jgi:outer membrane lipopolysaccharide assembly protein LptE/RlpB
MTKYRVGTLSILAGALLAAGCGYHMGGKATIIPATAKTIAIPAFTNGTVRFKVADSLTADVAREFHSRTKYVIVTDPAHADLVLNGSVTNFSVIGGTTTDPVTGRATSSQVVLTISLKLTDTHTGKVLLSLTGKEIRERYQIAEDLTAYFDESSTAVTRVSRDAAQSIVSLILEAF